MLDQNFIDYSCLLSDWWEEQYSGLIMFDHAKRWVMIEDDSYELLQSAPVFRFLPSDMICQHYKHQQQALQANDFLIK